MKSNAIKLLELLEAGEVIVIDNYELCLSSDNKLCFLAKDDQKKELLLPYDCSFNSFLKMASELNGDELWLQKCSVSLRKMNTKKKKKWN